MKFLAYHSDPDLKRQTVEAAHEHRRLDILTQQATGKTRIGQRGCSIACIVGEYEHNLMPELLGVPIELAYLNEHLFESLSAQEAGPYHVAFVESIPVGADLSLVWSKFALWLLVDPECGVIQFADDRGKAAIQCVAALFERRIAGDEPTAEDWDAAAGAADAAVDAAADAAEASVWAAASDASDARAAWAADAAGYAAWAADWAAGVAVWAAGVAARAARAAWAAGVAAGAAATRAQRDKFLELLAAAPIPESPQELPTVDPTFAAPKTPTALQAK